MLSERPLDVVSVCRAKDLPILRLAHREMQKCFPLKRLHIVAPHAQLSDFRRSLGSEINLINEDELIPGMTLANLKTLSLPGFPGGAGWYFQQLLKFAFGINVCSGEHFLIWDADTIPLRPIRFFDASGRMLLTKATEFHAPYFENFRRLLKLEPNREFSFIAQHMIVHKEMLRAMLTRIELNNPGDENWAWKLMRNLRGESTNLFSEYEFLGHYAKILHPERVWFRNLAWLRDGSRAVRGRPSDKDLATLRKTYDFVAFEASQTGLRRLVNLWRTRRRQTSDHFRP